MRTPPRRTVATRCRTFAPLGLVLLFLAALTPRGTAAQDSGLQGPPSGLPSPGEGVRSIVAPEGAGPDQGYAGDHLMYIGTYRNSIYVLDEATEEVVDIIELESGIPRSLFLNAARDRFYVIDVSYEHVEVVDIATHQVVDRFTLSRGNETVRIWNMVVSPGDDTALLLARRYRRLPDRFEVGPMEFLQYDLVRKEVVRELPWPDGRERQNMDLRFSADGRWIYFMGDPIRVLDARDLSEVDRWAYADEIGSGLENFSFGFPENIWDEPGTYRGLVRVTDAVQGADFLGVARASLDDRTLEVTAMGPWVPRLRFTVGPDRRKAYGVKDEVGDYQFWTFDLDQGRVESSVRFRGRSRMLHEVSSSGRVLYIYNAGNTIDLYDTGDYRYLRTIVMDADTTSRLFILPRSGSGQNEE
jgi:hypothetical protein